jgi:hypothetical protein
MPSLDKKLRDAVRAAQEILAKDHNITAELREAPGKRQWCLIVGKQRVNIPCSLHDHHSASNWIKKTVQIFTAPATR